MPTACDSNATAAHFGLAAGVIRPSELAAGEIDHALFMVVKCTSGTSVYPAGPGVGSACADKTNAPAMGQHFFLEMTDAQIEALSVPSWQKTILRAMARYGLYVGDTGGSGWGIQFESGSSFTSFGQADPWVGLGGEAWRQVGQGQRADPRHLGPRRRRGLGLEAQCGGVLSAPNALRCRPRGRTPQRAGRRVAPRCTS